MVNIATIHFSKINSIRITFINKSNVVDINYGIDLKEAVSQFFRDVKAIGLTKANTAFLLNFK